MPRAAIGTETEARDDTQTRLLPPYNLILLNDDFHSFEFVVMVLCKALGVSVERSYEFTLTAHKSGQVVVWTGSKEVAELKLEQVQTFHEVRENDGKKLGPVDCRIEPAPGA